MIERLSHSTVYVADQDRARAFYVDNLGFEVRQDATMGNFRWLTVGPASQPDVEIVLMPLDGAPTMDPDSLATLRALVVGGKLGAGVFATSDCRATYRELVERGVEFRSEPTERPYGLEAIFVDDTGNWFSLTERR